MGHVFFLNYVCVCGGGHMSVCACGGSEEGVRSFGVRVTGTVSCPAVVPGIKIRSYGRASTPLDHRVIFPGSMEDIFFNTYKSKFWNSSRRDTSTSTVCILLCESFLLFKLEAVEASFSRLLSSGRRNTNLVLLKFLKDLCGLLYGSVLNVIEILAACQKDTSLHTTDLSVHSRSTAY